MKKRNLKSIAVLGISTGLLIGAQQSPIEAAVYDALFANSMYLLATSNAVTNPASDANKAATESVKITAAAIQKKQEENIAFKLMSEDDLYGTVNSKTWKLYESLTPEGKALAINIASRSCDGSNECKGQGACKDDSHDCAGQNDCKGKSKCNVSNKNLAVKLAANIMAKKRGEAVKALGPDSD